jgi:TolA-binding protein
MTTRQQIEKLKKQLLWEELRRRGKKPRHHRWLWAAALALLVLLGAGVWYQLNLDEILEQRYQKGLALRDAGQHAAAAELLAELQADHPSSARAPAALLQAAELLHINLGRYQEALVAYLTVERDYAATGEAARARRQVAELYKYRLDDQLQAIAAYQRLIDGGVDCYFRLNNFEQARLEFESLLIDYPGSPLLPEVQFRLAMVKVLEGDLDGAMAAYREVTARWPQSPYAVEAQFGLAGVLEERDRLREALEVLDGLQGRYPNPDALAQRIAYLNGRIDKQQARR